MEKLPFHLWKERGTSLVSSQLENANYMKDQETGALVSSDLVAFNKFKSEQDQVDQIKKQKHDLNSIESDVSDLKAELGEIKDLLKQLLNK